MYSPLFVMQFPYKIFIRSKYWKALNCYMMMLMYIYIFMSSILSLIIIILVLTLLNLVLFSCSTVSHTFKFLFISDCHHYNVYKCLFWIVYVFSVLEGLKFELIFQIKLIRSTCKLYFEIRVSCLLTRIN